MPYNGHLTPIISTWLFSTADRLGTPPDSPISTLFSAPYTVYGAIPPVISTWPASTADRIGAFSDSPIAPLFSEPYTVYGWITDWWPFPPPDTVLFAPTWEMAWTVGLPEVFVPATLQAPAWELAWNIGAPVFVSRVLVTAPAWELALGMDAPSVTAAATLSAPAWELAWNVGLPEFSSRISVFPPTWELALEMGTPSVSAAATLQAPAWELAWTIGLPAARIRVPVYPPVAEFTLTFNRPRWETTRFHAGHSLKFTERGDAGYAARFAEFSHAAHRTAFAEICHAAHSALFGDWVFDTVGNSALFSVLEFDIFRAGHALKFAERGDAGHALAFGGWIFATRGHSALFGEKILDTRGHALAFEMPAAQLFHAGHAESFSAADGALVAIQTDCYIELAGRRMEILGLTLRADAGSYCWAGEVELARAADYRHIHRGDLFTLHLQGDAWTLEISDKSYSHQGADRPSLKLPFLSPTARLERGKITKAWGATSALAAATEAADGVALDWQIADWQIPAGRLAFSDAPRIAVIQAIAQAVGGFVQTTLAGGLVVRYRYQSPVSQWGAATPDNVYLDTADNLAYSESYRLPAYHGVFITDAEQADAAERQYASEFTSTGEAKGLLRVYAWPWFDDFEIVHTGPATLQVSARALREVEAVEQVEFRAGAAETQFPVYQLQSSQWKYASLGAVSWRADSRTLAASGGNGYGLAEVRYIYRVYEYQVAGQVAEDVQFLVLEAS